MKISSCIYLIFSLVLIEACSKGSGPSNTTPPPGALPFASINDVSNERTSSNLKFQFTVTLDKASTSAVSINYTTSDGTALSNKDYKPINGVLTIPANSNSGTIEVEVVGDSIRRTNQSFSIQLSNPTNCSISTNKGTGTIVNENLLYFPVDSTGYTTPKTYPGMNLVWSDEFDGKTVNTSNWVYETGSNNGWGNNELENYTNRTQNSFVSKGNLIIEARNESYNGSSYTSARMITKAKQFFTYGRIDVRAKLPFGKGLWPAIWMLGNNIDQVNWPACGEMDIMELIGSIPNTVNGTLHWGTTLALHKSKTSSHTLSTGTFDQQFHVYSLVWVQDQVQIYVDDILYNTVTPTDTNGTYPFNLDFFFILNVAVGGSWPGSPDGTTVFPQRMVVDYVRVFK